MQGALRGCHRGGVGAAAGGPCQRVSFRRRVTRCVRPCGRPRTCVAPMRAGAREAWTSTWTFGGYVMSPALVRARGAPAASGDLIGAAGVGVFLEAVVDP